jgi:hypothetical protein
MGQIISQWAATLYFLQKRLLLFKKLGSASISTNTRKA